MSLTAFQGVAAIPAPFLSPSLSDRPNILNAAAVYYAWVISSPSAGVLNSIEFSINRFIQCTNGLRISIQGVDSSGNPDGVETHFRVVTIGATGWFQSGLITTDGTNGGAQKTVAVGELYAIVARLESFATNDDIGIRGNNTNEWQMAYPPYDMSSANSGGSWTKRQFFNWLAIKYDAGYITLSNGLWPINDGTFSAAYANNSTPDEKALRFKLATPLKISGIWLWGTFSSHACDIVLYDSDGTTPLATTSIPASTIEIGTGIAWIPLTPTDLLANTVYRISVKPTSTSSITLYYVTVGSAAVQACIDGGVEWYLSTRTDAGAWSETTTIRPMIGLLVGGAISASGGLVRNPGGSGGVI